MIVKLFRCAVCGRLNAVTLEEESTLREDPDASAALDFGTHMDDRRSVCAGTLRPFVQFAAEAAR
jgi:hypothetical protein